MKTEISLLVEEDLLKKAEEHAQNIGLDVSSLVEAYFKSIKINTPPKNILELIEQLPKPNVPEDLDLKKLYWEEKAKKYGF